MMMMKKKNKKKNGERRNAHKIFMTMFMTELFSIENYMLILRNITQHYSIGSKLWTNMLGEASNDAFIVSISPANCAV